MSSTNYQLTMMKGFRLSTCLNAIREAARRFGAHPGIKNSPAPKVDTLPLVTRNPDAERLFKLLDNDLVRLPALPGPILVWTKCDRAGTRLREMVDRIGAEAVLVWDAPRPEQFLVGEGLRPACAILDVDYVGRSKLRSAIRQTRSGVPGLPVIALSSGQSCSEFDPARADPADVVLKAPATPIALKLAISSAGSLRRSRQEDNLLQEEYRPEQYAPLSPAAWQPALAEYGGREAAEQVFHRYPREYSYRRSTGLPPI